MSTKCEICNKELSEENFQNHLFDEHHLLFCQYIGLISDKLSFEEFVIRPVKRIPKPKKEPKRKRKKKNEEE
jgi:hypothetical protein